MSLVPDTLIASHLDVPSMRDAGAQLLSLGLMDSRNQTLHLAQRIEQSLQTCADRARALIALGQLTEKLERHGAQVALWCKLGWGDLRLREVGAWSRLQAQLLQCAEEIQDQLMDVGPDAAGLAPYRAALELEDRLAQSLVRIAHLWANAWAESVGSRAEDAAQVWGTDWPAPRAYAPRQPLWLPSRIWTLGHSARLHLGHSDTAFAWSDELHHSAERVPEFDMDAQPVSWAQFVEFVDDGGYDREELWNAAGWEWVQAHARRSPLFVEQLGVASGAVLQRSFGRLTRRASTHACMHVNYFEADAFARWCGRRLPTEIEWEIAAAVGGAQGFRWGDVMEWTGSRYEAGGPRGNEYDAHAGRRASLGARSVRGSSFAALPRNKLVCARFFAQPERDDAFIGFRTCSL